MARLVTKPTLIEAAGTPPKKIEEYVGRINTGTSGTSIARMISPGGWSEPGQTADFSEYTLVLKGALHVQLKDRNFSVHAGQAIVVEAGEWVRYSTPNPGGAEYISVCFPAFSPGTVHRDE